MEINIIKNMQSAPYMGSRFGQDVEPKGTYVIQKHGTEPAKYPWVDGKAVLENPLFIDVTVETLIKYKYELTKRFKAKGKQLTNKLMDRGYDAIVTRFEDGSTGEIILFPNAKFTLDMKNESKLLIKNILRENINQADKIYFKSGKLSDKARAIVFNITKGDAYTRLVTDMYYVMFKINEKFIEGDILDNKSIKKLQESYQDLLTYNKNVFPIIGLNVNGTDDISNLISSLEKRRGILEMFKKLPSIAYRNMKSDIRKERTHSEMSRYNSDMEHFMAYYSQLSNRDDSARAKIDAKMFKKDATLSELINFVEEKENLVGGTKFTKNKIKEIVKEDGYDLEIVYDKGNIMIVEVSGPEGIKKIGCNSLWCFTYGSGFDSAWRSWNNYSTNGLVYVIINFNESPDSPEFMHVLIKPLQDEYDEDEYENPSTLFDMSNEVQYDTNNVISYFMDFETAKRIMNFGEEVPEPIKEPKKQEPYKDPNQLSLFEIRQKLREGLHLEMYFDENAPTLVDEDYPQSWSIEEFKKLTSFNSRIKYCETHLQRISSGSSRIVYKIDEEKVLKLAKNKKGLAQNEVEIEYSEDYLLEGILAKIYEYDENNLWVEMELAQKLTKNEFKRIVGFSFDDFAKAVNNVGVENTGRGFKRQIDSELFSSMWDNEFITGIFDLIGSWGIPSGDLQRMSSYGIVSGDSNERVVLIDYGLTNDVYNTYYS
jgi:hypothetical protein